MGYALFVGGRQRYSSVWTGVAFTSRFAVQKLNSLIMNFWDTGTTVSVLFPWSRNGSEFQNSFQNLHSTSNFSVTPRLWWFAQKSKIDLK